MGINNLLQFLKPITKKSHIKKYKDEIIGVDIMCWIHRSLVSCAFDIVTGKDNDRYLKFIIKMLDLLQHYEVKVVAVFDGDELPAKKLENELRRNRRNKAKEEVLELVKKVKNPQRNTEVMKKCFQALSVSKEIIHTVINLCKEKNIEYIIAPYEADAQLSYLCRMGYISAAISEDSDLLVYGCPRVLYKMKDDGSCYEIKMIPMNDLITLDKIMQIKNPLSSDNNEIFITPIKNIKKENQTTETTTKENTNQMNPTKQNDSNDSKEHSNEPLPDTYEITNRRLRRNCTNSHEKKTESNKIKMGQCVLREKGVYKFEKKEKEKRGDAEIMSGNKEELYQHLMNNYINHFKWPPELDNLKYFDLPMFITMCILSGCDYSNDFHVNGMGIRKAFQLVYEFKNVKKLFIFLTKEDKWKFKLPRQLDSLDKLLQKYKEIENAFTNHPVYDIATGKIIPIKDSFQSVVSKRKDFSVIQEIIQFSNENIHKSLENMKQQMELIRKQRFEQTTEKENNCKEPTDPMKPFDNKLLGNISPGTLEFLEISSSEKGEERIFTPSRTTIHLQGEEQYISKVQIYSQDSTPRRTIDHDDKNITNVCYNVEREQTEPTIVNDLMKKEEPSLSGFMDAISPKHNEEISLKNTTYYDQTEDKSKNIQNQHIQNNVPSFYEEDMNVTPLQFSFETESFSNFLKMKEECSAIKNESSMHEELKKVKIEISSDQQNKEHHDENKKQKIETRSIKDSYKNISRNYSFSTENPAICTRKPITQTMDKENESIVLQGIDNKEQELVNVRSTNISIDDLKKYNYRNCDINIKSEIKNEIKNELNIVKSDSKLPIVSPRKYSKKVSEDVQQMKITTFFKKTNKNKDDENISPKLNRIAQTERYSSGGSTHKANSFEKTQEISPQEDKYVMDLPSLNDSFHNSSKWKQQSLFTPSKRKYEGNNNPHSKRKSIFSNKRRGTMDIRCFGSTPRKETALTQSVGSIENLLSLSKDEYVKENLSNSYNCNYSKEYEQRNEERKYDGTSPLKKEWKEIIDSVKQKHSLNIDLNTLEECTFYENQLRQVKRKKKEITEETNIYSRNTNPYQNSIYKESDKLKIETNITTINTRTNECLFENSIQQQKQEKSKNHTQVHTTNENNNNINSKINNKPRIQEEPHIYLHKQKENPKCNFITKSTKLNPFDYFKEMKDPVVKNPYLEK